MYITPNWKHILIAVFIAALLLASGIGFGGGQTVKASQTLALQSPPFISHARAQASPELFEIGEKLDDEAGIAAYFQSLTTPNLEAAKSVFKTIELDTPDYILGSVGVPNEYEHFDTHVYVHKDGWLLAYYFKNEPGSKIIDVRTGTISTTKLTNVLSVVAAAAGVPFTGESYYDFRYPNATNILFVAEDGANGYDFTLTIPSNYGYFERGWAESNYNFYLDGTNMRNTATWADGRWVYGSINAAQLLPGVPHYIQTDAWDGSYGVLMITYQELP